MQIEVPASLPIVDTVDIVVLRGIKGHRVDEFMLHAASAPFVTVHESGAQVIASLWRKLPPGKQMRCHIPPFGFRFLANGQLVCQASVCWQCNNIHGKLGDHKLFYEFNASHPTSEQLLAEARRSVDESTVG
jgi:hypothetical protein